MKYKILIIIFFPFLIFGQNAGDYFPSAPGYKWFYRSVPLDSLNNTVDSLTYYGIDSFAVSENFKGRAAEIILTKSGLLGTINYQQYRDSLYFSFEGTNGYEYFDPVFVSGLIGSIDTILANNFFTFFNSLEGWYSYYRFNSAVNQSYSIFSKDTTVTYDSTSLPLRFQLIGKRLADENISTEIGTFNCKKFLLERRLSYLVTIPPLPTIAIKILGVEETIWMAPSNWKVKSYIPSTTVDFSVLGIPVFTVPGLQTDITSPFTDAATEIQQPGKFVLYQNYPNPFNPSTRISWSAAVNGRQTLKIYDVLGNEVLTLLDEEKPAGFYEIEFNRGDATGHHLRGTGNLASGIYFYKLTIDGFVQSKKMILLK